MHGLNWEARSPRYRGWAVQNPEDMRDDFLHSLHTIRLSDKRKALDYPFSTDAVGEGIWQITDMDGPAFDPQLVRERMKERGVTQTGMAQVMRLTSQSAFSNILKGKRRVTAEEARLAYDFLGIQREPSIQWVPVIGITNAGQWREAILMPLGSLPVKAGSVSEDAFAVEVSGDSMDQLIPNGGHIIVDPRQKELRDGKVYLIQNTEGETTVKAYHRSPARFEPMSSNGEYTGWLVSEHDFVVLGRVVFKLEAT